MYNRPYKLIKFRLSTMNPERKNQNHKKYAMPAITAHEKKLRRLELLLLKEVNGFYLSHLCAYLRETKETTLALLREIEAVELGGFWVHVMHRVPCGTDNKVDTFKCVNLITADPFIPVFQLMRKLHIQSLELLITNLQSLVSYGVEVDVQHAARCYLLRKFNIEKNLVR